MRQADVNAHKVIWLLVITIGVFVFGVSNHKKPTLTGHPSGGMLGSRPMTEHPIARYINAEDVVRVGDRIYMDGLPMTVESFETQDSPDSVIKWYAEQWTNDGLEPSITEERENYKVVGAVDKGSNSFMTVTAMRLKSTNKTLVFPSYHDMMSGRRAREYGDIPIYPHNLDRYLVDFDDMGNASQNDISLNDMTLKGNQKWWKKAMKEKGWTLLHDELIPEQNLLFLIFQKGQRGASISINHTDGKSAVLINIQN